MKRTSFVVLAVLLLFSTVLAQEPTPDSVRRSEELIEKAGKLMSDQKPEEALALLGQAVQMNPRNPTIPYRMAVCEFNIGVQQDDAERILRAHEHLDVAVSLDPRWGEPFFFLGVMGFQQRDYRKALFGFENSLQRGYRVKDSHANRAQGLFFWGVELARDPNQSLERIIDLFAKAMDAFEFLKDDLRFPVEERERFHRFWIDSMINLSSVHLVAEDRPEAEGLLRKLIALEPKRYLHYFNLGLVLGRSEAGWQEAIAAHEKALELNEDESWIEPYPRIGYILSQLAQRVSDPVKKAERAAEAESWFVRYLDKYPNSVDPLMRLGDHYRDFGAMEKAIDAYRRGIRVDPLKFNVMHKLGIALPAVGRAEEGKRWIELFTELSRIDREAMEARDGTRRDGK